MGDTYSPSQALAAIERVISDKVLAPNGAFLSVSRQVYEVADNPLHLAGHEFAAFLSDPPTDDNRNTTDLRFNAELTVVFALPLQQHEQAATRRDAMELTEALTRVLHTQENLSGILCRRRGRTESGRSDVKLITTVRFQVLFTWRIQED